MKLTEDEKGLLEYLGDLLLVAAASGVVALLLKFLFL